MDISLDDLIEKLAKNAHVTINIQGGTNNEFYAAPVQVKQTTPEIDVPEPHCYICGFSGGDLDEHSGGLYSHYVCRTREENEARRRAYAAYTATPSAAPDQQLGLWRVVADEPTPLGLYEPEESPVPLQTTPPHLETIAEKYADSYRRLIENGAEFGMAQAEYFASLSSGVDTGERNA